MSSRHLRLATTTVVVIFGALTFLTFVYSSESQQHVWTKLPKQYDANTGVPSELVSEIASKVEEKVEATQVVVVAPAAASAVEPEPEVDWARFAYLQYVTDSDYLCNSVMVFESLHRLGSKADRVMMYPSSMVEPDASTWESDDARLLLQARDEYNVSLQPIQIQHKNGTEETWADSFTKLLAFNQTQYDRVLCLDSDSTILQHMDELFLLPPCPVAMPRAYWLHPDKHILASQLILVHPNAKEFERVLDAIDNAGENEYDMEIMNKLYEHSALIIPHRSYGMLTAEFRGDNHAEYLGSDREQWDPAAAFNEAKFVHFSDWPVPKPWIGMPEDIRNEKQPPCRERDGVQQCIERELWNGLYHDFAERRERVCKYAISSKRRKRSVRMMRPSS